MRRREALLGTGAVLSTAVAGCLGDGRGGAGDGDESDGESDGNNESESGDPGDESDDGAGDDPDADGGDDTDGDGPYPDYGDDVERTVGYDEADPDEAPGLMTPSARSVAPGGSVSFTLENRSDETLNANFYAWRVHKRVDGEWFHVAPRGWNQPLMTLAPGDAHTWTVAVENDRYLAGEAVPRVSATEDVALHAVGGGEYAFGTDGWFESSDHEAKTAFAATVEVDADPLALVPTNAVAETEWDGETLVARTERGDPDDDRHRLGAYELRRVDDPGGDPTRVITEQVARDDRLRDALALAREHEADRVRLEEYDGTTPIFGAHTDGRYEYDGAYYEVTTRELEE